MKIAFDHQTFTYQSYGGISRYYIILADELLKLEQDVSVFAGVHQNNYLQDLPGSVVCGLKLNRYPPKTGRVFQWLNHAMSQAQIKYWQPDIIHETYYSSWPRLHSDAIRVTSVYDMIHELYKEQFSSRDKTTLWKKETFNRVNHIISISHSTKKDLVELFGIDESKISVVHLGVDVSAFERSISSPNTNTRTFILYVGARGGYKNFSAFIRAVGSSPSLINEFDVVAFGGGKFNADEMQLIKQLGFEDSQVKQVGGGDEILAGLYHQAAAFVYPSLYEGFGLPPLEAMAAGCPVVSSNTSSMPEVVRKAGVYFNPNDIEDIRNAIEKVVYSTDFRSQLIEAGFENVKGFSWKKCAQETLSVYQTLTGKV